VRYCSSQPEIDGQKQGIKTMRPIYEIANEIRADWSKPYFGAVPYLEAMETLKSASDNYYYDSGKSVILYFLANASTWRGDVAKRVKAELKQTVGIK
jgi:hypothetical protein